MKRAVCLPALALALALTSCGGWWNAEPKLPGDHIKVPHARHAAAQVECLTCHETVYDATSLDARFLPDEATCLQCHREQKEKGNCGFCHTDVKRARPWAPPQPTLLVSHAAHLPRTKEDCTACHKQLPEPLRTRAQVPTMATCLGCHEHEQDFQAGRCARCHTSLERFPLEPLSRFSHQADYLRSHPRDARSAAATCQQCHEQTFCADCHANTVATRIEVKLPERVEAAFIHRNDFLSRHIDEAAADPASCRRCHGSSFCESCHQANNLTPFAKSPRDPHPPGWSFPGSREFHGTAARRDITQCAACHDQGARSICVDCHKVGGIGGDPHPPGFATRHGRDEIGRNHMCAACHL